MRTSRPQRLVTFITLCCVLLFGLLAERRAQAGGPLIVGGTFGPPGQPFLWSAATEVQYRTDGGNLGILSNSTANQRVAGMFQVWEDVPTAVIGFNRAGNLLTSGAFGDGDVNTASEFNAVDGSCGNGQQSPIIYDTDGSLFASLGLPLGVIGFAGPCALSSDGHIVSAVAALNGNFRDGAGPSFGEPELTDNEFDAVFIHEFGHFFGLDHSQINLNCMSNSNCPNFSDDAFGLPTMFPFLISGLQESPGVHPARTLSMDDIAWVSRLYPTAGFNSSFGSITGTIFFSDGQTPTQGVDVIARRADNPRRFAVSVVSGFLFTGNPGQSVTANYLPCSPPSACPPNGFFDDNSGGSPFGSRDTNLIGFYEAPGLQAGSYTVEVESVFCAIPSPCFSGGSSVGPLDPPIFSPGPPEFFNVGESSSDPVGDMSLVAVNTGAAASNINIVLNGTRPGFDSCEPDDTVETATPLGSLCMGTLTDPLQLTVSPFADQDVFSFRAVPTDVVQFDILEPFTGSPSDPVIEIVDSNGQRLSTCSDLSDDNPPPPIIPDPTPSQFDDACVNDDFQLGFIQSSSLAFRAPVADTYFLRVLDFRGDGRPDLPYSILANGVAPTITSLSPPSGFAGRPSFTLTVFGFNFGSSPAVLWNGTFRETTLVSGTTVQASILAADIAAPGTAEVTVANGSRRSNALPFTIILRNPLPTIANLSPPGAVAGAAGFMLAVNGSNFVFNSEVHWDGALRTTTFVSSTQLQALIPATDLELADIGMHQLTVLSPSPPGGGTSNPLTFSVQNAPNPAPTLTSLVPDSETAGAIRTSLPVMVTGSNFINGSVVRWNGMNRTTSFVDASHLTAIIPSSDLLAAGTAQVTVFSPAPGGGTSGVLPFTINNSAPTLTSLVPDSSLAGGPAFTLTVVGSNFLPGAVIRWNGSNRTTNFAGSSQLQASIPANDIASAGMASVTVLNPEGGGLSNAVSFDVNNSANPFPVLTSLSPPGVLVGGPDFTLTVNGSGFIPSSVIRFAGADRLTTFVNSNQLTTMISSRDITTAYTPSVRVFNPGPGGGLSAALPFFILSAPNPVPIINSLSPNSLTTGGSAFTLTVNGSNFVLNSVVRWNGSDRPTTFMGSTRLTASIPASDLLVAGSASVTVSNPVPGGGGSSPFTFTIIDINPAPTISSFSPSSASVGASGFSLTLTGSGFVPDSVGRWNGADRPTSFVNESQLSVAIPASDLGSATSAPITVFNPAPGGGNSAPVPFQVFSSGLASLVARVSVASDGTQANNSSATSDRPSISEDGRFIAFVSKASNLMPGDTNGVDDVFVRDTCLGVPPGCSPVTVRASVAFDGTQSTIQSLAPSLSNNGRLVSFASGALDPSDTNGVVDVYVRDTCLGTADCTPSTTRVSLANDGSQFDQFSFDSAISATGRYVAFTGSSGTQVFLRDTCIGTPPGCSPSTILVGPGGDPSISVTGRYVAFTSSASDLVANDTNGLPDIFVRDTCIESPVECVPTTIRASVGTDGSQTNAASFDPAISGDGRYVAFATLSNNLVPGDTNNLIDVFVRDTCFGTPPGCTPATIRASLRSNGSQTAGFGNTEISISSTGRFVSFRTADPAVPDDTNIADDAFVRDTCLGAVGCAPTTKRVSVRSDGSEAFGAKYFPVISANASAVAFVSVSNDLVPNDTNGFDDVFAAHTGFSAPSGSGFGSSFANASKTHTRETSLGPHALAPSGAYVATRIPADALKPVIESLEPAIAIVGSGALRVTVSGENFAEESVLQLRGKDLPTKFVSEAELEVELPAAALAQPGELKLTVFTPGPGGGTSKPATLQVQAP